jgi:CheY-like chemotaxis protein
VLVVEDHPDARESLRMLLALDGHEVDEASDGPTALEKIIALRPDVALVDIGLPGLDGYMLAQAVRAAPGGKSLYLVALTGYGQPEDRRRAIEAGFDAHLVKPVEPDRLRQILARATTSDPVG